MGLRYTPRHEAVGELLESRVKSRRTLLAVAEEEGVLLGFVCAGTRRVGGEYLCEGQGAVGYVDDLYVRRSARGRGIASALADRAEAWMAESGVEAVELHVLLENPTAAAFWRSRGMEPMSALCYKKLNI
ncbi:MAG: GNAT family N-acetyltransferase [Oscillospiraceae bacterium]|nr:GNAT family N-acetyltransferase [Oscillospiraceae bacterium]MCI9588412.1 GNAT family N-acetyltransferase [Oscillospiraceae bacterium]